MIYAILVFRVLRPRGVFDNSARCSRLRYNDVIYNTTIFRPRDFGN